METMRETWDVRIRKKNDMGNIIFRNTLKNEPVFPFIHFHGKKNFAFYVIYSLCASQVGMEKQDILGICGLIALHEWSKRYQSI